MNYDKLTDAELSMKLFMSVNVGAIAENAELIEAFDSITYSEDDDVEWFSILDFADLMPIAIDNRIFYEFKLGDDYNRDEYKAVAVFEHGHDHVTFDYNVCRAIAICLLKTLNGVCNEYR